LQLRSFILFDLLPSVPVTEFEYRTVNIRQSSNEMSASSTTLCLKKVHPYNFHDK